MQAGIFLSLLSASIPPFSFCVSSSLLSCLINFASVRPEEKWDGGGKISKLPGCPGHDKANDTVPNTFIMK